MDSVPVLGKTGLSILVIIRKIKNKAKALCTMQMEKSIEARGKMDKKTDMDNFGTKKIYYTEECGKKEDKYN